MWYVLSWGMVCWQLRISADAPKSSPAPAGLSILGRGLTNAGWPKGGSQGRKSFYDNAIVRLSFCLLPVQAFVISFVLFVPLLMVSIMPHGIGMNRLK